MHPLRRQLLFRFLVVVALIVAASAYASYRINDPQLDAPPQASTPPESKPFIPAPGDQQLLADATRLLNAPADDPLAWTGNEPKLLELQEPASEEESSVTVRMIFLGGRKRYALIGNHTYGVGDMLPDGRTVTGIEKTMVKLEAGGQETALNWTMPTTTLLTKPEQNTASASGGGQSTGVPTSTTTAVNKNSKNAKDATSKDNSLPLNTQQARQLLDQLKNIPGVITPTRP